MIEVTQLNVNGHAIEGLRVIAPGGEGHPNMLVLLCKKGYVMCGYLNEKAAEKFGDAACIVGGADFDETLKNPVKATTPAAEALGVRVGMTGAEAVEKLNG